MNKILFLLMLFFLCSSSVSSRAVGQWDLFDSAGTTYLKEDVLLLPSVYHTASLLEFFHLPSVTANVDSGGQSALENNLVNSYGSSVRWQRYFINGVNANNPLKMGQPIFDVPLLAWDKITLKERTMSLNEKAGINWFVGENLEADKSMQVNFLSAGYLGGPTFLPERTLDREPGQSWGASSSTRFLKPSIETSLSSFTRKDNVTDFLFVQGAWQRRQFEKLNTENSAKGTLLWNRRFLNSHSLTLGYSIKSRENEYIEWRNAKQNTWKSTLQGLHASWQQKKTSKFEFSTGINYAQEDIEANSSNYQRSLFQEIHNAPLKPSGRRLGVGLQFFLNRNKVKAFESLDANAFWSNAIDLSYMKDNSFLNGGRIEYTYNAVAQKIEQQTRGADMNAYLISYRPEVGWDKKKGSFRYRLYGGLAYEAGFSSKNLLINRFDARGGFKSEFDIHSLNSVLVFGLGQEVVPLNFDSVASLHGDSLSKTQYAWSDANNDLKWQKGESGGVLYRYGGRYTKADESLKAPVVDEINMGIKSDVSESYSLGFVMNGRVTRNLLKISYAKDFNANYQKVNRPDSLKGYLYERNTGSYGEERYILTNNPEDAYFASTEIQLIRKRNKSAWFFNLSVGGYIQMARPVAGNGPFYNDIGVLNFNSADPNNNLAEAGRTDYDRGYMANLVWGVFFNKNMGLTNTMRYRDGQSYASYLVAEGLKQGTIAVIDNEQANGLEGVGRYTFYLNWDMRFFYKYKFNNKPTLIAVDINNFLNSQVPFSEIVIRGPYNRKPTEVIPERSIRLLIQISL